MYHIRRYSFGVYSLENHCQSLHSDPREAGRQYITESGRPRRAGLYNQVSDLLQVPLTDGSQSKSGPNELTYLTVCRAVLGALAPDGSGEHGMPDWTCKSRLIWIVISNIGVKLLTPRPQMA